MASNVASTPSLSQRIVDTSYTAGQLQADLVNIYAEVQARDSVASNSGTKYKISQSDNFHTLLRDLYATHIPKLRKQVDKLRKETKQLDATNLHILISQSKHLKTSIQDNLNRYILNINQSIESSTTGFDPIEPLWIKQTVAPQRSSSAPPTLHQITSSSASSSSSSTDTSGSTVSKEPGSSLSLSSSQDSKKNQTVSTPNSPNPVLSDTDTAFMPGEPVEHPSSDKSEEDSAEAEGSSSSKSSEHKASDQAKNASASGSSFEEVGEHSEVEHKLGSGSPNHVLSETDDAFQDPYSGHTDGSEEDVEEIDGRVKSNFAELLRSTQTDETGFSGNNFETDEAGISGDDFATEETEFAGNNFETEETGETRFEEEAFETDLTDEPIFVREPKPKKLSKEERRAARHAEREERRAARHAAREEKMSRHASSSSFSTSALRQSSASIFAMGPSTEETEFDPDEFEEDSIGHVRRSPSFDNEVTEEQEIPPPPKFSSKYNKYQEKISELIHGTMGFKDSQVKRRVEALPKELQNAFYETIACMKGKADLPEEKRLAYGKRHYLKDKAFTIAACVALSTRFKG